MNKKKVYGLGLVLMPIGALFLTACGSVADRENADLKLAEASNNYYGFVGPWTEYGLCNDGWDNDGNGLRDVEDPACHVLGPVRDLSLFPAPLGHNFAPDISVIPAGSPGSLPGGFRDRDQITRWMRFLTDTNGYTAGIDLFGAAMDSPMVPVPVPLFPKVLQGTAAQGNNNNIDGVAIPLNAYIAPALPAVVTEGVAVEGVAVEGVAVEKVGVEVSSVANTAAAPAPSMNTRSTSYKPEMFQHHHRGQEMKIDDHRGQYAPRYGMDTLGRQANYAPNNGYQASGMLQNRGYTNNAAAPSMANTQKMNNLDPNIQGTSLLGTNFGSPSDWPTGTTGPGYQSTSLGRQVPSYGQANGLGNQGLGMGALQNNGYGQRGYPQSNNWGAQSGALQQRGYPQANAFGQGLGQGHGAYSQGNNWGAQPGAFQQRGYPQGNSWGLGAR